MTLEKFFHHSIFTAAIMVRTPIYHPRIRIMNPDKKSGTYYALKCKRGEISQGIFFKNKQEMRSVVAQIKSNAIKINKAPAVPEIPQFDNQQSSPEVSFQSDFEETTTTEYESFNFNPDSIDYYPEFFVYDDFEDVF